MAQSLSPGEFAVSRPQPTVRTMEPGDWLCINPKCDARGNGPKPRVNFGKNRTCGICYAPKPAQPCAWWQHYGDCRRQTSGQGCQHTRAPEDRNSKYGLPMPDYILGRNSGNNMSSNRWQQSGDQWAGETWSGYGNRDTGSTDDDDLWRNWQASHTETPPPVDRAAEERELSRYLLAASNSEELHYRINQKIPEQMTQIEMQLAHIQARNDMQLNRGYRLGRSTSTRNWHLTGSKLLQHWQS